MSDDPEPFQDLAVVVQVLQEVLTVIDDHDPDRNPARCMRPLRRLLNISNLRNAVRRLNVEKEEKLQRD